MVDNLVDFLDARVRYLKSIGEEKRAKLNYAVSSIPNLEKEILEIKNQIKQIKKLVGEYYKLKL